jgi:roadblock/LC7 domain-containing protein
MFKRGLYLNLIHNKGYWNAGYYSPDISLEGYASGFSRGVTEWEARTRAAISALERSKKDE